MNLVAKEFVAAQDPEDPGALVLSEFAGAAEQLQAALLVNPHDIAAHRRRHPPRALDAARGAARALAGRSTRRCASRTSPGGGASSSTALDATAGAGMSLGDLDGLRLGPGDALFLDFDGTLAEIGPDPDAIRLAAGDRRRARPARARGSAARWRSSAAATSATSRGARPPTRLARRRPRARGRRARRRPAAAARAAARGGARAAARRRAAPRASGSSSRARSPRCTTAPRPRPRPPASPPPRPPPPPRPASCTSPARWWSR